MEKYGKEYKQRWRLSNAEHLKNYQKEYLKNNNGDVQCEVCNGHYKRYNKNLHERALKHIRVLDNNIANDMKQKIIELEYKISTQL